MPQYSFQNPDTGEIIDVKLKVGEKKEYKDSTGKKWDRIFTIPQAATKTKLDPFNQKDFVDKTRESTGSIKDLWDRSAELSEKRKDKVGGLDPIKQKYWNEWSTKRKGKKHPDAIKEGYHKI